MGRRSWLILSIVVLVLVAGVVIAGQIQSAGQRDAGMQSGVVSPESPSTATDGGLVDKGVTGAPGATPESYGTSQDRAATDRLVIRSAQIAVRVQDVDDALDSVKRLASSAGATVQNLSVSQDGSPVMPLGVEDVASSSSPRSASVTLRVPADKLAGLIGQLEKIGTVTSQSEAADDVTEQHVDLSARLKNMQAEEVRLRSFFDRAKNVTEMLAIETELARVRGEIESLQAQIDYLERQAAQSTLTIDLYEPGSVVRPDGVDWGFREAVTAGVQAAATAIRTLLTIVIALAPFALVALIVWAAIVALRRRRSARDSSTSE